MELASTSASPLPKPLMLLGQAGSVPVVLACKAGDRNAEAIAGLLAAGIVLSESRREVETFPARSAHGLKRVDEASVPLFSSEEARFVFRQPGAADNLAVIIGRPPRGGPVGQQTPCLRTVMANLALQPSPLLVFVLPEDHAAISGGHNRCLIEARA